MKYDLSSLNENQIKAVTTTDDPLLIIACPGSGKTKTLVEKVLYLIIEKGIKAKNIFVSTFTEKAAKELISRISNKLLEIKIRVNINEMFIGTLHSIFLRILEEYRTLTRLKRNFRMLDQFDQKYFIYQKLSMFDEIEDFNLLVEKSVSRWNKSEEIINLISKVSEECLDIQKLINSNDKSIKILGEIYKTYLTLLDENNAIDFSSIQNEMYNLITNNENVLKELQEKIQYIMVDEYQDTNTIQEMILLKLAGGHKKICVVGDDDQGLYRFRGATIRNILEFDKNFKDGECKKIYLSINYRSHPDIINFSQKWIESNDWNHEGKIFRFEEKEVLPKDHEFTNNPAVIKVSGKDTGEAWHQEILAFINDLKKNKKVEDLNQIAFIFASVRSDKPVNLANFLEDNGIYVYSPRSNMFFQREEIRLIIGAILFMFPQFKDIRKWNSSAHLDVWDYYDECFKFFCETIQNNLNENKELGAYCAKRAREHTNLQESTDYAFSILLYELLQFKLFANFIDVDLKSKVYDVRSAYNIAMFSGLLNKFEYLYNFTIFTPKNINDMILFLFNQFMRFLIDGGITEYEDFDDYVPSGCISFLTVHQSKGLEFPVVITDSLANVPRKQFDELDEILQKNYYSKPPFEPIEMMKFYDFYRLFYVAFSRAKELLVLSCLEKEGRGKTPSKYFEPIYKDIISWKDERFDIKKIELSKIMAVDLKKEYSFTSNILLYENCARQYKFYKELEFIPVRKGAMIFGVLIHQTIEDIHKTVLKNEYKKITPDNITSWFNINYELISKSERVYLIDFVKQNALEQVLAYEERNRDNFNKIIEAEVDVSLVKDDYILTGKIDLIEAENNTVHIVDFKSIEKPDVNKEKDRIELDKFKRQLEVYAHIVEERTKHKVSGMRLYYTSEIEGNPYITFTREEESINETINKFDNIVKKIEKKDFDIKERPFGNICKNCDMRHYCDRRG